MLEFGDVLFLVDKGISDISLQAVASLDWQNLGLSEVYPKLVCRVVWHRFHAFWRAATCKKDCCDRCSGTCVTTGLVRKTVVPSGNRFKTGNLC